MMHQDAGGQRVQVHTVAPPGLGDDACAAALDLLERGHVLYFPQLSFPLTAAEQALVSTADAVLPTRRQRRSQNGRPTILFDPIKNKLFFSRVGRHERATLESMMSRFSAWALELVRELAPQYAATLTVDRVTYRPCRRATPQGVHVDASYGNPTEGKSMLRIFANVNPFGEERVWRVGETFAALAERFVTPVPRLEPSTSDRLLEALRILRGHKTPYDRMMACIRARAKRDRAYQQLWTQSIVRFAPATTWIAFTDLASHGAVSGQHSLDQTFYVPASAFSAPDRSSLRILERLSGLSLA